MKKILLVDDEPVTVMAVSSQLKKHGFEVESFNNGSRTLQYLKNHNDIDLIILDIELNAQRDGIELAKIIEKDRDIPILFLTAHEDPEFLKRAEQTGSYNYLIKNSSSAMLVNAINQALKLHKARRKIKIRNQQLQEKEEQYRKIVQSSRDAMAIIQDSRLIFVNNAFIRFTANDKENYGDTPINRIPILHEIQDKIETFQNSSKSEIEFDFEYNSDSSFRYVRARLMEIEIQFQPALFITLYDFTELKKISQTSLITDKLGDYIPICASCKKIKDDEGDDPWIAPERYIGERLPEIKFTHGLCPDCIAKLYPDYKIDKKDEGSSKQDNSINLSQADKDVING